MSKPAKIFFLGVVISLAVLAVGYLLDRQEQSALDAIIVKCKTETMEAPKEPGQKYQEVPLVCEPTELIGYPL